MPATMPSAIAESALVERSSNRRPDIQGLRAVAVLMVVAFHAGLPMPGGFVGVDVFFVISGFVITAMLHREWLATGRIRFGQFYLRRFKRLTPALALMVAVTMLISALVLSPVVLQQNAAATAVGAMLLFANVTIANITGGYFDAPAATNPLLNTWSLSVEEQFYLVFPALLTLGWVLARRQRLLHFSPVVLCCAVGSASFALAVAGSMGLSFGESDDAILGYYSPFTRVWEFAFGALLALVLVKSPTLSPRLLTTAGLSGAALLVASMWLITGTTPFPGTWTLVPVTGTLLLLLAGTHPGAPTTKALATRPLVVVGDRSYSIYLWHWPMIVFAIYLWPLSGVATTVATAISLVLALASYRWVEQPIRNLPALSRTRTTALIAAVMIPPLALAGIVNHVANNYWMPRIASGDLTQLQGEVGRDSFIQHVMHSYPPCVPEVIREHASEYGGGTRCNQTIDSVPAGIAIIGDSHADMLFPGIAEAAPGVNVAEYFLTGNPPVASASEDMARILEFVSADPVIHTVIVNAFWERYDLAPEPLAAELQRLRASGKNVFVATDVPDFPFSAEECKYRLLPMLPSRCAKPLSRDAASARSAVRQAVASAPGVHLLDSYEYFCVTRGCSMARGTQLMYRDANHLNLDGSRFLALRLVQDNPELRKALKVP